jgi:toxin ParE1/3/4
MKVIWRKAALGDLDEIWHYVAKDNSAAASKLEARIRQRVMMLADFPLSAPEVANGQHRLVVAGTAYIVMYRVQKRRVVVDAVFHGARNR